MNTPDWKINRRKLTRRTLLGSAIVAGALSVDQGKNEIDRLQVEHATIKVPRWTAGALRIAFLTDWHLSDQRAVNRMKKATQTALDFKPDMVLYGGDYISSTRTWRESWTQECFAELKSFRGTIAGVYGNHDYNGRQGIANIFRESGQNLLINDVLVRDGIKILGLDDGITGSPTLELVDKLAGQDNLVVIFHEPDYAVGFVPKTSLTLCGHTHGGQICLPGGFPLHLPRGGRKFVGGEYRFEGSPMYVSRGLGTSGPAVRSFCRPEVTILDLTSV